MTILSTDNIAIGNTQITLHNVVLEQIPKLSLFIIQKLYLLQQWIEATF